MPYDEEEIDPCEGCNTGTDWTGILIILTILILGILFGGNPDLMDTIMQYISTKA